MVEAIRAVELPAAVTYPGLKLYAPAFTSTPVRELSSTLMVLPPELLFA